MHLVFQYYSRIDIPQSFIELITSVRSAFGLKCSSNNALIIDIVQCILSSD